MAFKGQKHMRRKIILTFFTVIYLVPDETSTQRYTKICDILTIFIETYSFRLHIQFYPAIAHFKGLINITLYIEVFTIAII